MQSKKPIKITDIAIAGSVIAISVSVCVFILRSSSEEVHERNCMQQMRNIYTAMQLYTEDNPATDEVTQATGISSRALRVDFALQKYLPERQSYFCPSAPAELQAKYITSYTPRTPYFDPAQTDSTKEKAAFQAVNRASIEWIKKHQSQGKPIPILVCYIHDYLYYIQKESHIASYERDRFVNELLNNGTVLSGRRNREDYRGTDILASIGIMPK